MMCVCITGDGSFSFQEFVEIVYNMGGTAEKTADQEEKELRDAFRVNIKYTTLCHTQFCENQIAQLQWYFRIVKYATLVEKYV